MFCLLRVSKLITQMLVVLFNLLRGKSIGYCVKVLSANMGLAYIKLAQILATQDLRNLFTERDRKDIAAICDAVNPVPLRAIRNQLPEHLLKDIKHIDKKPTGAASISQVHRAVLRDGTVVAIKIKRKDVERNLLFDVKCLKVLMFIFGPVFGFSNRIGGNCALNYYYRWVLQEVDFVREHQNIIDYSKFAESVNGKVAGCVNIVTPKVYSPYCTDSVIVMEYIEYKTLNQHTYPRDVVNKALNSYVQLNFWALLHNRPVVFHGDPHPGNIYIDANGNIGFLDMGLVFGMNADVVADVRQLFLCAYFGNADALCKILVSWFHGSTRQFNKFTEEVRHYCKYLHARPITAYFMDLATVCKRYPIEPASYLYELAKAFVCLDGFGNVYTPDQTGYQLLLQQVTDYCVEHGVKQGTEFLRALVHKDIPSALDILYSVKELRL